MKQQVTLINDIIEYSVQSSHFLNKLKRDLIEHDHIGYEKLFTIISQKDNTGYASKNNFIDFVRNDLELPEINPTFFEYWFQTNFYLNDAISQHEFQKYLTPLDINLPYHPTENSSHLTSATQRKRGVWKQRQGESVKGRDMDSWGNFDGLSIGGQDIRSKIGGLINCFRILVETEWDSFNY
jgi:hypothetical protein